MAGLKNRWRNKLLLLKTETTYGTDAAPAAGNVIRAQNVSLTPLEADEVKRENVMPYLGAQDMFLAGKHVSLEFEVEMAGSGTAGTAPAYAAALLACGMAETVSEGVSVEYNPVSEDFSSATIYLHIDKVLHKTVGCLGNMSFKLNAKNIPILSFKFLGLFVPVVAGTTSNPDFSAFKNPVVLSKDTVPVATLHGYTPKFESLEIDLGQKNEMRSLCNDDYVNIGDREASGTFKFDEPEIGDKDFYAIATAHTRDALAVTIGTVAGNIVEITAPAVQIGKLSKDESSGVSSLSCPLILHPDEGNDELILTFK